MQLVPENIVTGFHLKDILDATKKYSEVRTKLYDCILFNKRFPKTLLHDFTSPEPKDARLPTEEEGGGDKDAKGSTAKTKKKIVRVDLVKLFGDLGAPECVKRLQKQDLLDAELFFRLELGTLEGFLEITPEGKKMRVMKKINELRDKYEKDGKVEYLDLGLLEESPEAVRQGSDFHFKRSTTAAFKLDRVGPADSSLSLSKAKSSKEV